MTTTPQVRRHQDLITQLDKENVRRDDLIAKLGRSDGRLRSLRKAIVRSSKRLDAHRANAPLPPPPAPEPAVTSVAALPADDLEIPGFLKRAQDSKAKDVAAAEAIRTEQQERKTAKARGRIATMKAKQSGETRRMPLTGRAALAALRDAPPEAKAMLDRAISG